MGTGLRLHAAACRSTHDQATIVGETILPAGEDLVIGGGPPATLVVPDWTAPPLLVISGGTQLHLGPGMRVNMCGDEGKDHIVGTYEELLAGGMSLPIPIALRRMNIRVTNGLSVFAHYLPDSEASELFPTPPNGTSG
jgi:hypothetical protein